MKLALGIFSLLLGTSINLYAQDINAQSTTDQKVGYSFGYIMGKNSLESLDNIDLKSFIHGFTAAANGQVSVFSDVEMANFLTQYKQEHDARVLIELKEIASKNLQLGEKFLAENANKSGISKTKSGLQYEVFQQGKGKQPKQNSTVKVHYEGRLLDGTVFDSSIARDQPAMIDLNHTISGWTEALQLMKLGAKYRFYMPADLSYGAIGSGDSVPPNSMLIFDIELLEILSKQ